MRMELDGSVMVQAFMTMTKHFQNTIYVAGRGQIELDSPSVRAITNGTKVNSRVFQCFKLGSLHGVTVPFFSWQTHAAMQYRTVKGMIKIAIPYIRTSALVNSSGQRLSKERKTPTNSAQAQKDRHSRITKTRRLIIGNTMKLVAYSRQNEYSEDYWDGKVLSITIMQGKQANRQYEEHD